FKIALDPDRLMRFIGHGIRTLDPAGELDRAEILQMLLARAADLDHHTAVVTPGAPDPVVIVSADGGRQPQPRAINVDGSRLPVIAAGKHGFGAFLWRQ